MEERLQKIVAHLRGLPEEDRWKVAVTGAGAAGFFLLLLWLLLLPLEFNINASEPEATVEEKQTSFLGGIFGGPAGSIKRRMREFAAELERDAEQKSVSEEPAFNEAGVEPSVLP